jgi:mRNA-degrading endonuclease RelE of RelBE toxin-antitoxin system
MKIIYAEEFVKQFQKLPPPIRRLYRQQEALFIRNWRDPRLHVKKLIDHPLPFSFRITRNYRVLFVFINNDQVLFATIGNRKDVYKK